MKKFYFSGLMQQKEGGFQYQQAKFIFHFQYDYPFEPKGPKPIDIAEGRTLVTD